MTQQPAPRVFISYSHDTLEHQERVLALADRLRADGIDAEVDQYNTAPAEGWPLWCERQIAAADVVLMVCTETYHRRVSGDEERGKSLGVVWEARIIRQLLYDAGAISNKFVPILFSDASPEHIPTPIKGWTPYVVDIQDGYEDLYRRLTEQPRLMRPALGTIRALPPRRWQWPEGQTETTPPPDRPMLTARAIGEKNVHISENEICEPIQAATPPSIPKPSGFKNFQASTRLIRSLEDFFSLNYFAILSVMVAFFLTAVAIYTLKELSLINKLEDLTGDIYMRIHNELSWDVKGPKTVGFIFINIDDESFTTWTSRAEGSVLQTPRDKLQALIHFAVQADPALIVVDVDLSLQPGQQSKPSDADKMLTNFLRNWESADRRQSKCLEDGDRVPILLQREIVPQPDWSRGKAGKLQVSWHELERAVDDCQHLHWVSTLFKPSPDGVIRRWRSCWEAGRNGHVQLVPSAHYLARTILNDHQGGALLPRSAEDQAEGAGLACLAGNSGSELCASLVSHRLAESGCDGSEEDRRFLFPIRWSREGPPRTPLVSATGQPLLRTVPASQIVECSRLDRPECKHVNEIMTGRIVVIGGTYNAARDWHPTPVGVMPGAIILINAMHTALNLPQVMERELQYPSYVLLIAELFIIISLIILQDKRNILGRFKKFLSSPLFIFLIFFIPLNIFLSFYYMQFGMWIVPTLAILGMLSTPMFSTLMGRIWRGTGPP